MPALVEGVEEAACIRPLEDVLAIDVVFEAAAEDGYIFLPFRYVDLTFVIPRLIFIKVSARDIDRFPLRFLLLFSPLDTRLTLLMACEYDGAGKFRARNATAIFRFLLAMISREASFPLSISGFPGFTG